jgi:hypothetical protein
MPLRLRVPADLIEHRALRIEDAPIGIVRRVCAVERIERLGILTGFRQRAAISAEQPHIVRISDRGLLQNGDGLGALIGGAQRPGVGHGRIGIARIFPVADGPDLNRLPPFGFGPRRIGCADRAGGVVACGLAAGHRQRQHGRDSGRGKQLGGAG